MNKLVPTEHEEQATVIEWFDLEYPQYQEMLFAIPNGSYKGNKARASFKDEGLRPGVPDLFLPVPIDQYHGLFIEMKRQKGSVTSDSQKLWIKKLNKHKIKKKGREKKTIRKKYQKKEKKSIKKIKFKKK